MKITAAGFEAGFGGPAGFEAGFGYGVFRQTPPPFPQLSTAKSTLGGVWRGLILNPYTCVRAHAHTHAYAHMPESQGFQTPPNPADPPHPPNDLQGQAAGFGFGQTPPPVIHNLSTGGAR